MYNVIGTFRESAKAIFEDSTTNNSHFGIGIDMKCKFQAAFLKLTLRLEESIPHNPTLAGPSGSALFSHLRSLRPAVEAKKNNWCRLERLCRNSSLSARFLGRDR
jgi:hypothetical protein